MMDTIASMYITLLPAILAGIGNMVWCSISLGDFLRVPMDGGRCLKDGRPLFGFNKTWKGFLGMILFSVVFTVLWGWICGGTGYLHSHNYLYVQHTNTFLYNLWLGFWFGLAYALCELPNSFLKRRIGIEPGKPLKGSWAAFFVFLDQADSVFGMVLVVAAIYPMGILFYLGYVLLGAATHIVFNVLLYLLHLRKNPF